MLRMTLVVLVTLASCSSVADPVTVAVEHERWAQLVPLSFASLDSEIVLLHVANAAKASGTETPVDSHDGVAAQLFVDGLAGTPLHAATGGMGEYNQPAVWEQKYGFALAEAEVAMTARTATANFTMIRPLSPVSFDELVAAAGQDPLWGDRITVRAAHGYSFIDWGSAADPSLRSPGRPQGVGGYATVVEGWSVFTQRQHVMEDILAVAAGDSDSALTDEGIQQVLSRIPADNLESLVFLYSASPKSPWESPGMRAAASFARLGGKPVSTIAYFGDDDFDSGLQPASGLNPGSTVIVDGHSLVLTVAAPESFIVGAQCLGLGGCTK